RCVRHTNFVNGAVRLAPQLYNLLRCCTVLPISPETANHERAGENAAFGRWRPLNNRGRQGTPSGMSFITQLFIKPKKPALIQLPAGSFTVDPKGRIITSTLPQSFRIAHLQAIGNQVLGAFRSAEQARM